jgi:hypothetical protein
LKHLKSVQKEYGEWKSKQNDNLDPSHVVVKNEQGIDDMPDFPIVDIQVQED